jgi:hypothetical protein
MKEFKVGLRFEMYYWYADYAVCFDFATFIDPVEYNLIATTKLE